MKFSIITVCFNSEKTIERTLNSVLLQSSLDIEYIVIDGNSTDNTLKIINSYVPKFNDKGIECICISESDNGMYDAMNKGIEIASGDIIGILNSDDWYEENALKIVNESIQIYNADIYMGAINVYNGGSIIVKKAQNRRYKTSRHFNHPAMFVTKECYKDVGQYGINNIHSDYGWYLKAMKMDKTVYIINHVITNYSIGGKGSIKSINNTISRIKPKYQVYLENGYSKVYFFECFFQEMIKYLIISH